MKFSSGLLLAAAGVATAQVAYDNSSNTWSCPIQNGSYCAGDSLQTNAIILCTNGVGYYTVCDGHLEARPPIDVYYAPCWQQDPSFGNATCSKNCTVWPDMGAPYPAGDGCQSQPVDSNSYNPNFGADFGSNSTNSTNSTGPYANSTATGTSSVGPSRTPSATFQTSTATSTSGASALLDIPHVGSSIFGAAMFAVAAFAL